jgi:hypothetical protein
MSCIDSDKVRYKSPLGKGLYTTCHELKAQEIGSIFFVSHETGEHEPDQLCHRELSLAQYLNEHCGESMKPRRVASIENTGLSCIVGTSHRAFHCRSFCSRQAFCYKFYSGWYTNNADSQYIRSLWDSGGRRKVAIPFGEQIFNGLLAVFFLILLFLIVVNANHNIIRTIL